MCDNFKIIQSNSGFVLINTDGGYSCHAHLRKRSTCQLLIELIGKRIVPRSEYLRGSCLRLTTDEEYKIKILQKQAKDKGRTAYFNANKGVR